MTATRNEILEHALRTLASYKKPRHMVLWIVSHPEHTKVDKAELAKIARVKFSNRHSIGSANDPSSSSRMATAS